MAQNVDFTYTSNGRQQTRTLLAAHKIRSHEAMGLWQVGNRGWKVYATTEQLTAISADYTRAQVDAGLPVGTPPPSFQQGTVRQGNQPATHGFVLIAQWMDGTNFQKTTASFRSALTREKVPRDRNSQDHRRCADAFGATKVSALILCVGITAGCIAANKVGLRDGQGFVRTGIIEPIRFVDVHTSWNSTMKKYGHSEQAQALVDTINAWV